MEQQTQLSIGQIVYTNLYNLGKGVIVNIHGKQKPESIQNIHDIMVTGGNAEFDIVFFNGEKTQRLPECILHGIQWQIENDRVDTETIEALIQKAETFEKAKITEEEQKQHEFNQGVELQRNNEKYNHLTQRESKSDSEIKLVGKNIRADLKKHFHKTEFSVRMRYYTTYYISWSDGPTVDNVNSILMKYKTGCFNAYEDYHYNEDTPFNVIYGGVDYVFTDRNYSDEKIEMAIRFLLKKHGEFYHFDTNLMTVENFRHGKLWNVGLDQVRGNNGIQGEIHRVLSETTY